MAFSLFGFQITKKKTDENQNDSFVDKTDEESSFVVQSNYALGGGFSTSVDLDGTVRTEAELINKYRSMAQNAEVQAAITEIVNEIVDADEQEIVKIVLDDLDKISGVNSKLKKTIESEFQYILELLDFQNKAYDWVDQWYVDGRLKFHAVTDSDPKKLSEGIKELRYIDPRKLRRIKEVANKKIKNANSADVTIQKTVAEYYIYNPNGFTQSTRTMSSGSTSTLSGLKIAADSIISVNSGLVSANGDMVLSWLHLAIKFLNELRSIEDSAVIYRLVRAPERRVWYIDVGDMPKLKAEQYVQEIMNKQKNRVVYDAASGQVRDDRKFMTMLEDFWLARRGNGQGTKVETLPAGTSFNQMDDILYFQKRLYKSLGVPITRLDPENAFTLGQATQITRDELKFSKFVARLRNKFAMLFIKTLERQLILKGIVTYDEWLLISKKIKFDFQHDNYFTEFKETEVLTNRIQVVQSLGYDLREFYSKQWIKKNILKQTDEEIEEMQEEMDEEKDEETAQQVIEYPQGVNEPAPQVVDKDKVNPQNNPKPTNNTPKN